MSYPKCAHSLLEFCSQRKSLLNQLMRLENLRPFDVTLRDGLQSLNKQEQENFTLEKKKALYKHIICNYKPKNIEIGSFVNNKILPIFKDTEHFFPYTEENNIINDEIISNYVLVPNEDKMLDAMRIGVKNFSLITSVSNNFQIKNTKMSLLESDKNIYNILFKLYNSYGALGITPSLKLYVSCINECPIIGKIDNDFIVNRLLNLNKMKVDSICLSDTCGTLTDEDFEYIVDTCSFFGIPSNKFALHLHVKEGREKEVEKIIHKALDRKITNFDVSLLDSGGCSVTMDKKKLSPNLSYQLYYKSIFNYIVKKSDI
jgi:isopropylmalate/homocitrate/citramalate synthase